MLENFPEYTDCLLRLAAIAARGGKRAEALGHLRTVLKQRPGDGDALAFMGAGSNGTDSALHVTNCL